MLRNFSFVVENELAGCAHPEGLGECDEALQELKEQGIGALVSLDESGIPLYMIADHDFHYLHLPIPDFGIPKMKQAREFVEFVRRECEEGRKVAVHCGAGLGRTGTMIAVYIVAKGSSADDAIRIVRETRPGSIETTDQEKFVHRFEKELNSGRIDKPSPIESLKKRFGRKKE